MQEELNATGKKASKIAKNVVNNVTNKVEDVTDEMTGGSAREKLGHVTEMASDYLSNFNSSPLSFVRQYPIQAAIGGVVLGFILGSAVSRSSVTE